MCHNLHNTYHAVTRRNIVTLPRFFEQSSHSVLLSTPNQAYGRKEAQVYLTLHVWFRSSACHKMDIDISNARYQCNDNTNSSCCLMHPTFSCNKSLRIQVGYLGWPGVFPDPGAWGESGKSPSADWGAWSCETPSPPSMPSCSNETRGVIYCLGLNQK